MNELRRNTLVGLFVLVGLGSLATLIVLFGQHAAWLTRREAYQIEMRFTSAAGIRPGTVVTIGGIDVGRVTDVDFVDRTRFADGVKVMVAFESAVQLRRGSRARTSEPGMGMGRPPILVDPGPPDEDLLASGEVIYGEITNMVESLIPPALVSSFDRTRQRIEDAAAALTPVLEDMHDLMQRREMIAVDSPGGPPGNLSTAMARLDSALRHFNEVLGDPQVQSHLKGAITNVSVMSEDGKAMFADLRQAAADARQITADAKELVGSAQGMVRNVDDSVQRVSRKLLDDLDSVATLLAKLNQLADSIGRGEGTVGQLMKDPRLYDAMVLTFQRLAETVQEFKLLVQEWQKGKIRVGF